MSGSLPLFRYHPDPLTTGAVRAATETCVCCERDRGWIYAGPFYSVQDVGGSFCPWCIADGSAAERFAGEFSDSYGLEGVGEAVLHEVTRRTPGFRAWQDPHWLVHCGDAAAFVGEAGYARLAEHPEVLDQLQPLAGMGQGATAMLFRRTRCGTHLAYVDAS
ncbi:CbrC family protein [Streptomyces sp. SS1-1]|uniref:CbrC family protein n=1 Tax=Streptomyces sp. SS1-1 TaxID=2651869 RepID=UPI00124F8913|nr:CbrC family protein [Streptomyces sp. SS1-1]KAB2975749.1 CbrC family protein [Streptomyces sp. SS1-1]